MYISELHRDGVKSPHSEETNTKGTKKCMEIKFDKENTPHKTPVLVDLKAIRNSGEFPQNTETFPGQVGQILDQSGLVKVSLPMVGGGTDELKGPFPPKPSHDSE